MTKVLAIAAGALLLAGCSDGTGPSDPVATNQVAVRDNFFNPSNAQVTPGTTVTWTWSASSGHDVVFQDGQGNSAVQASGSHTRAFPTAGTFRYRCTIHSESFTSGMVGQVLVQ